MKREEGRVSRLWKLSIVPPDGSSAGAIALSPDGRLLAFVAPREGKVLLWIRRLDSDQVQALPGTENAADPFWSPDSRFIGFFAGGKLKKIDIAGGPPQIICDAPFARGGAWNGEGTIVFAPNVQDSLFRVSASGGSPIRITKLDPSRGENSHRWPQFLPDGRRFIYFARSSLADQSGTYLGTLDSEARTLVMKSSSGVSYASPGYLLWVRDGILLAQPFDSRTIDISGDAVPVGGKVADENPIARANFSASETGVVAYSSSSTGQEQLVWLDRAGRRLGVIGTPSVYLNSAISPDETKIAIDRLAALPANSDIWIFEATRGIMSRFTFTSWFDGFPVWSPDGSRIVFASAPDGRRYDLYQKPATGTGREELIHKSSADKRPLNWSPDGRYLIYATEQEQTKIDLWILPMLDKQKPFPFAQSPFNEFGARFSPDGTKVAYTSDESGRYEVYVQTFSGPAQRWLISSEGGREPRWRADGKELFYIAEDGKLMSVEVTHSGNFRAALPQALFQTPVMLSRPLHQLRTSSNTYDVSRDGQRFLIGQIEDPNPAPVNVLINWPRALKR